MNCTVCDISFTMLQNLSLFASSSGASTSSSKQNGAGLILKIENTNATRVPAFSPPEVNSDFLQAFQVVLPLYSLLYLINHCLSIQDMPYHTKYFGKVFIFLFILSKVSLNLDLVS